MKIDIDPKLVNTTDVIVNYKMIVTNTEEVAGKARIVEKIPEGFTVNGELPEGWEIVDGNIII